MRVLSVVFLSMLCLSVCNGYRFLGMFPFPGRSHFIMFERLMMGLASKGHQIDMVSSFPLKKSIPNYTDIVTLVPTMQLVNNVSYEKMMSLISSDVVKAVATIGGNNVCEFLRNPEIQKLVRNPPRDPPYDAVFIEIFGAPCFVIIGHLLNVPVIGVSTTALYPWLFRMVAQPENLAFVPNNCLSFPGSMNFWERLYNVVHTHYNKYYFHYLTKTQDEIIREVFGPNMPSVRELETKLALVLVNSHIALNGIKPTTPAAVEVGGLHIQDEGLALPPELERWMNESTDGFVYFTFGSMVMIETFPRSVVNVFYSSLSKIAPVRVLMKVPKPEHLPAGLPANIYTYPWMPQIKVLQHPNIRAFITHGGLMGTQEAVACGVPMIGVPLFADQFMNIDSYVARNIAVRLDIDKITVKNLDAALNTVLHNPTYRESARHISQRFLDRPLSSIDTANYWIEYVVKYGSNVLRSPAMDLAWWQLGLLDVYVFLLLCLVIVIGAVVFIVRFLLDMTNVDDYNRLYSKKTN